MQEAANPAEGSAFYMVLEIKNEFFEPTNSPSSLKSEIYLTKDQMIYRSNLVSMFQNSIEAFIVVPANKQIFCRNIDQDIDKDERKEKLLGAQLDLIKKCKVTDCYEEMQDSEKCLLISMQPENDFIKKTNICRFIFTFHEKSELLKSMKVIYAKPSKVKSQDFIYHTLDFDYKPQKNIPIEQYLFAANGKLNSKYQEYQLIDNRN